MSELPPSALRSSSRDQTSTAVPPLILPAPALRNGASEHPHTAPGIQPEDEISPARPALYDTTGFERTTTESLNPEYVFPINRAVRPLDVPTKLLPRSPTIPRVDPPYRPPAQSTTPLAEKYAQRSAEVAREMNRVNVVDAGASTRGTQSRSDDALPGMDAGVGEPFPNLPEGNQFIIRDRYDEYRSILKDDEVAKESWTQCMRWKLAQWRSDFHRKRRG